MSQCDEEKKESLKTFQIVSWIIGRGLLKKLPEIMAFLKTNNVRVCFMIEVDEKNLQSLIIPDYSIFTGKVGNQNDKVRIIALVHEDLDVIVKDNLMNEKVQTIWLKLTKDTLKKHYCWWNISPMEQTRC